MSESLYSYPSRPYHTNSDDDSDDDLQSSNIMSQSFDISRKRKRQPKKPIQRVDITELSDDDSDMELLKVDSDDENTDTIAKKARETVQQLLRNRTIEDGLDTEEMNNVDDTPELQRVKERLRRYRDSPYHGSDTWDDKEDDLAEEIRSASNIHAIMAGLPVVRRASDRFSGDSLLHLNMPSQSSRDSSNATVSTIKLQTRLNGKHKREWELPTSDSMQRMRDKFADAYGLSPSQISFHFDGNELDYLKKPEDLELEDEDLIDVKVDNSLYSTAVENAEARNQTSNPSSSRRASQNSLAITGRVNTSNFPSSVAPRSGTSSESGMVTAASGACRKGSTPATLRLFVVIPKELSKYEKEDYVKLIVFPAFTLETIHSNVSTRLRPGCGDRVYYSHPHCTERIPYSNSVEKIFEDQRRSGMTDIVPEDIDIALKIHPSRKWKIFVCYENGTGAPKQFQVLVWPDMKCAAMMKKISSVLGLAENQYQFLFNSQVIGVGIEQTLEDIGVTENSRIVCRSV